MFIVIKTIFGESVSIELGKVLQWKQRLADLYEGSDEKDKTGFLFRAVLNKIIAVGDERCREGSVLTILFWADITG